MERVFRLRSCSEDDTIYLPNIVSLRRLLTVSVLVALGRFFIAYKELLYLPAPILDRIRYKYHLQTQ